ncbi:MAG: single-stranded-DNA-specific exonuclease RecJ [Erysipelotrichaceae bacterium]
MVKQDWVIKRWKFDKLFLSRLADQTGYPLDVCNFLASHGYLTKALVDKFLNPSDESDFSKYIDGEKLLNFLVNNKDKKYMIYGDYDCDGVGATSIAYMGLTKMGFNCKMFINSRFKYGYGLHQAAFDEIKAKDIDVVISVDQGVVSFDAIDYANSIGIEVLVIDHHKANEQIPNALAVVDPWRLDDNTNFKSYCAGALTYQMIKALASKLSYDVELFKPLLGIVALTTISDVMPLRFSNRYYVIEGLKQLNKGTLTAYKVLRDFYKKELNDDDLRFYISPAINAVGRLKDNVNKVLLFLINSNYQEALTLYQEIISINRERQKLSKSELNAALKQVRATDKVNIIEGDFHEGLVGIVAGRIKSETNKVTVVLSQQENQYKGSIRSIEGFNLKQKLDEISDIFNSYGGHDMAAGISFDLDKLSEFKERFTNLATTDCNNKIYLDYVYYTDSIDNKILELWDSFKPYGSGFECPTFGLVINNYKTIVLKEKYLKLTTDKINVMAFNSLDYLSVAQKGTALKTIVKFEKDKYQNYQAILLENELREL